MASKIDRQAMPEQPAAERIHNFSEVALGYDEKTAMLEAQRCLHCGKPRCMMGCPVHVNIPGFIHALVEGNLAKSIDTIKETSSLPAICGRVCPQENQCEKFCILGIKGEPVAIGRLERFVADWDLKRKKTEEVIKPAADAQKVAVIGSGPAGLAAAGALAKKGYRVTIFEALHKAGGVLSYGIPEFRLPKDEVVQVEIQKLLDMGIELCLDTVVGKLYTIDELLKEEGFSAVFIGTGAGLPHFMEIPGEHLNGVYSANEFLTRCNLMKAYAFPHYETPLEIGKRVAVVGGGNVAMDAARTARRLGAEKVYIVYRRSEKELPARREEVGHAKEEGIIFATLNNPVEILGDEHGSVRAIRCVQMALGEPDESGRRRPEPVPNSEHDLEVDSVIISIGQGPNPLVQSTTPDMQVNKRGNIIADEKTGMTTKEGVFAGGDVVTGAATVILAMGAGLKAADAIDEYLQQN